MSEIKYKDKNWLFEQYFDLEKPAHKIGKFCNVSDTTIYYYLRKFGGKIRSISEAHKKHKGRYKSKSGKKTYKNRVWLSDQYWEKMKSCRKIGKENDVSVVTILYWMDKLDIKRRNFILHSDNRKYTYIALVHEDFIKIGSTDKEDIKYYVEYGNTWNPFDIRLISCYKKEEISESELQKLFKDYWYKREIFYIPKKLKKLIKDMGLLQNSR